ncbi:hypothetical protein B0I21_11046 [Sphingobacterium paludis]|uniref:Uncharacterized protein n=2 Tax=Sphingobacterium paludis TaxID=1476465 RepID=A0A4R7CVC7_9SPHI|nr:hypothetical protein B0I21_11046 [Sphingobacterium paludis]
MLKLSRDIGVSGVKIIFFVLFAYGVTNTVLVIFTFVRFFSFDFSWTNLYAVLLVLFMSICFTAIACFLTYRYMIALVFWKVYEATQPQRVLISQDIIKRATEIFSGRKDIKQEQLQNVVNWTQTVYRYYQHVPVFFQSGITQLFSRIPISKFIIDVKEDVMLGNPTLAAEKLYEQISNFFEEQLISQPSNRFTWLLLAIDATVLYNLATQVIVAG